MKTILFPTDFSKNASHAAEYAGMLVKKLDAKVILLHAFSIPMVPANHTSYNVRFAIESYRTSLSKDLEKFTNKFIQDSGLPIDRISSKIEYGFPADIILEIADRINADMIVMGTKGASNFLDKWLGTNAQKVMEEANCPVWIIPNKAKIEYPENVMYSADYQVDELLATQKLLELIKPLGANCNVVHVNDFFEIYAGAGVREMVNYLSEEFETENVSFQNINSEDIIAGLEAHIQKNKPNLLAFAMHEKSFLSKLFDTSISKHFVYKAKLPMLIFKK
jgi:nucleotide-binding universal stress UspA family protein